MDLSTSHQLKWYH